MNVADNTSPHADDAKSAKEIIASPLRPSREENSRLHAWPGARLCDANSRQGAAPGRGVCQQDLGAAAPFPDADFELSDTLIFIGANPRVAHPLLWQHMLRNKNQPHLIVIDPGRPEIEANAAQHLALAPQSDLMLFYGLANLLVQNDWLDHDFIARHTTGFAEFAEFVRQFTPDKVAAETGLTVGEIYRCAENIHRGKAVSFWWLSGGNQSSESARTAQAILNLALLTGNLGKPGTGANRIAEPDGAQNARFTADITSLGGGCDFMQAEHGPAAANPRSRK